MRQKKLKLILKTSALILASLILFGCASKPIIKYKTIEVPVERLVPIDKELTKPLDAPETTVETWVDVAVIGLEYKERWLSCEQRMKIIRELP